MLALLLAALVVAVIIENSGSSHHPSTHKLAASAPAGERFSCEVFVPNQEFSEGIKLVGDESCRSFRVTAATAPAKGSQPCYVGVLEVTVPLIQPPVVLGLHPEKLFHGLGCQRAIWSFQDGFALAVSQTAKRVAIHFQNLGSLTANLANATTPETGPEPSSAPAV